MRRGNNNQKDAKEEDSPGSREPWEADKGDVNGRDTVLSVTSHSSRGTHSMRLRSVP